MGQFVQNHNNATLPRKPQYFSLWLDYVGFRADRRGFGSVLGIGATWHIGKAQQQQQQQHLAQENTTHILITVFLFCQKHGECVKGEHRAQQKGWNILGSRWYELNWQRSGTEKNNGIFWTSLLKPPKSPWKIQILVITFCGLTIQKM